jgi:hypothetical protein
MDVSFIAEVDDQFVGVVLPYFTYVREQVSEVHLDPNCLSVRSKLPWYLQPRVTIKKFVKT